MSDCGCGSSDGNCTDNLNSNAKNAQVTGNINYDGANIPCATDSSLDITTNESINSVIQKISNKLCSVSNTLQSSSYLAHVSTSNLLQNAVGVRQNINSVEFAGSNKLKFGEVIKINYSGLIKTVATTGGINIKTQFRTKNSSGIYSASADALSLDVAAGNTVQSGFQMYVEITKNSNSVTSNSLKYVVYAKHKLDYFPLTINNYDASPTGSIALDDLVIDFTAERNDLNDYLSLQYVSMEHIRP